MDAEYSLHVTASKANMAWYTFECFAHIRNECSNSVTQERKITEEMERLEIFYLGKHVRSRFMKYMRNVLRVMRDKVKQKRTDAPVEHLAVVTKWREMFRTSIRWFEENAKENNGEFLYMK